MEEHPQNQNNIGAQKQQQASRNSYDQHPRVATTGQKPRVTFEETTEPTKKKSRLPIFGILLVLIGALALLQFSRSAAPQYPVLIESKEPVNAVRILAKFESELNALNIEYQADYIEDRRGNGTWQALSPELVADIEARQLNTLTGVIIDTLQSYRPTALQELGASEISIGTSLSYQGDQNAGIYLSDRNRMIFDMFSPDQYAFEQRDLYSLVHHELWHALEFNALGELADTRPDWDKCNALANGTGSVGGYLTFYGQEAASEDRAETWMLMITDTSYVDTIRQSDAAVDCKVDFLTKFDEEHGQLLKSGVGGSEYTGE